MFLRPALALGVLAAIVVPAVLAQDHVYIDGWIWEVGESWYQQEYPHHPITIPLHGYADDYAAWVRLQAARGATAEELRAMQPRPTSPIFQMNFVGVAGLPFCADVPTDEIEDCILPVSR